MTFASSNARTRAIAVALALGVLGGAGSAHAFETYALTLIPNRAYAVNGSGQERACITCHDNPDGGAGCDSMMGRPPPCLNSFGVAFQANMKVWNETLAAGDADGDGYTNGEELGDPEGDWRPTDVRGCATAAECGGGFECRNGVCNDACATRPGFATFTPGDADEDEDGYCCRGRDTDASGDCRGVGEHDTSVDCNDTNDTVASGLPELCTDIIDNDCDGEPTLTDSDCENIVDRDGDGFCPTGRDNNRDADCLDSGEMTSDMDCDDDEITVFPGARENCRDTRDNDCNMLVDMADPMCTSDVDADNDGYCPIGQDVNDNGNCNDAGETSDPADIDCDDTNAMANPDQTELCTDGVDNDCDGTADFRDAADCAEFFDADGDGYCTGGQDLNMDGDCADTGEDTGIVDCDDTDELLSPGRMEICTNGPIDEDCDRIDSLADPDCAGYLDTDGDRYCLVGFDENQNGSCVGMMEETGAGDCDDSNPGINPTIAEVCTDAIDNDCDGVADAADRGDCAEYNDVDLDGYCLVGQDMNDDADCSDAGEQGGPTETAASNTDPTTYPGAPENCFDGTDNNLDGTVDDPTYCTRDMDIDGDGWCPVGQDMNGDGDCLDTMENQRATDCNEMDTAINPGAEERCLELVDADCDGDWQTNDDDCFILLDRDGDGFCGTGIDDNADGDCVDEGEMRFGEDCNDMEPAINARARENCTNDIDDDCDEDIDLADSQCTCMSDSECDDLDSCTRDECIEMACMWTPDPTCGDAGPAPDGGTGPGGDGCGCRSTSPTHGAIAWAFLALAAYAVRRRKKRS